MNKSKIYLTNLNNFNILYGLYFKDIEDSNEYILAISSEPNKLENMAEYYLDPYDKTNYWIQSVEIIELLKNDLINQIKNILFFKKISKYKIYKLENIDIEYIFNTKNIVCFEQLKTNTTNNLIVKQRLFALDNKKNSSKNNSSKITLSTINNFIDGKISQHSIKIDKFYPESISNDIFY